MNKKIIFGVSAMVILGLGAGAVFSPQMTQWLDARAKAKAEQARYDTALKRVTSYIDSVAGKSSAATSWHLTVADPRTAPLAQWDKPGDKPQIITQIWLPEERKKAGLYTMNLDGTNLQTLLTADEVNGLVSWTKNLRVQRSPNGRYVFFNTGLFAPQKGCVLADLKTRQIERFGGDCNFGGWLPDSSKAYVSTLGKAYQLDTKAMKRSLLPLALPYPDTPEVNKVWLDGNEHGIDQIQRVRLINNGAQLLVKVKTRYNMGYLNRAATSRYLSYQVGDWQNYQQADFYPQECIREDYIYWREDGGAYSCYTTEGYRAYNANDFSQSALMADGTRYPLQLGIFNGQEEVTPRFTRVRESDELSPIDTLRYSYQLANSRDKMSGFSFYVPPALGQGFNQYDLVQDLPALPTYSQYQTAFDLNYQEQLDKCEQFWPTRYEGEWTDMDFYGCKSLCQIERIGSHFIAVDCKSTKEDDRG